MTRACVIGAGIGGLALAIRLQASGVETTLIEAREKPGGMAWSWDRGPFHFDGGPTFISDPQSLKELWQISGSDMDESVSLLPVDLCCRYTWPDGAQFDHFADEAALRREIARFAPDDIAGYEEFLIYSGQLLEDFYRRLGQGPAPSLTALLRTAPAFVRQQGWRSVHAMVSSFVRNEKLRQALSSDVVLVGGNPLSASAIYAMAHALKQQTGVWWPQGGMSRVAEAMAEQFRKLGGTLRLHDPVLHIHTLGDRASEVESISGWRERFDAVASNADVMHTYRDLLADTVRGREISRKLARRRFAPGVFMVHFAVEGSWPGIPHHTVLFGPRFEGLAEDIFEHGVLPQDMAIYLHHPTVTDPALAPPGKSVFYAMIPVPNMGRLPVDWEQLGPVIEQRILAEIGRRLIPDLDDRIVMKFHYAPRDFALDLNAWLGGAFSLEPTLLQDSVLRLRNRDDRFRNFYLVGAGTHPGAGIPAVLASAKATAKLMLEGLE